MEGFVRQIWKDLTHSNSFLEKKKKPTLGFILSQKMYLLSLFENVPVISLWKHTCYPSFLNVYRSHKHGCLHELTAIIVWFEQSH